MDEWANAGIEVPILMSSIRVWKLIMHLDQGRSLRPGASLAGA